MKRPIIEAVAEKLSDWKLNQTTEPIILGISGGVDSMVMLTILHELSQQTSFRQLRLIVAHFNHCLRESSQRDMDLVKEYADKLNLPYYVEYWQKPKSTNTEAEARHVRYQFFARIADAEHANVLMTAHHLNDQTETHLMRLVRGTSLKGWNGISEASNRNVQISENKIVHLSVLRPLLAISKEDLYDYAHCENVPFFEDETNHTDDYLRNRLRHHVVPLLQSENSRFMDHVEQMLHHISLSYQAHYDQFLVIEPTLVAPNQHGGWTLNLSHWWKLSQASQAIYLRILFEERIVHRLGHYSQWMLEQLEKLLDPMGSPNALLDLGHQWQAVREYQTLRIQPVITPVFDEKSNNESEDTSICLRPDNTWYEIESGTYIGIFEQAIVSQHIVQGETLVYHLNLQEVKNPKFVVRKRQPGDYMQIHQQGRVVKHKKISRLFIDEKITFSERENTWLVISDTAQVVWAIGIRKGYFKPIEDKHQITHSILYRKRKN